MSAVKNILLAVVLYAFSYGLAHSSNTVPSKGDYLPSLDWQRMNLEDGIRRKVEGALSKVIKSKKYIVDVQIVVNQPRKPRFTPTDDPANAESVKKFLEYGSDLRMILISSDSVFPDKLNMAKEVDQTMPQNVYGSSKEIAEKYILEYGNPHVVVRTTIIGKNINKQKIGFVDWIINSLQNGKKITLFYDAIFTPITIWSLSDELEWIIQNNISGVLHISSNEAISKYELGLRICKGLGFDSSLISKDSIDNYTFKAKRSKNQTLDSNYYWSLSNRRPISVEDTINLVVKHFSKFK